MLNMIRRTTAYLLALVTVFSLIPLQYARAEETELLPQETVLLTEPTEETAAMEEVIAETIPPETEVPEETTQLPEPEETVETLPQELPQTPEESTHARKSSGCLANRYTGTPTNQPSKAIISRNAAKAQPAIIFCCFVESCFLSFMALIFTEAELLSRS